VSCDAIEGRWSFATSKRRNVVWGNTCDGDNCGSAWSVAAIAGASDGETVVWGTADESDTVVWGTTGDAETVVWGTTEGDTVVWGTSCTSVSCAPVLWR
jgi:hypothetical protein